MSEMVERVAAAIDPEAFADWAVDRQIAAGKLTEEDAEPVLREKWLRQTIARDRATAAIAAMREPTEAMCEAAFAGEFSDYENDAHGYFRDIWEAMVGRAVIVPDAKKESA